MINAEFVLFFAFLDKTLNFELNKHCVTDTVMNSGKFQNYKQ